MNSQYFDSRNTLAMSDKARGIPGMDSPVPNIPNAFDSGAASKPYVNSQPYDNQVLAQQNIIANTTSAAPQAAANAERQVERQVDQQSDAEYKAQEFAAERMSEALYANEGGSALMRLNSVMQSPDKAKFMNDIAVGKAMAAGMNPDLGGEVAQANQYR